MLLCDLIVDAASCALPEYQSEPIRYQTKVDVW